MTRSTVLVTGALGYIGSHTLVELLLSLPSDVEILAIDNLSNSSLDVVEKVQLTVNCTERCGRLRFEQVDVTDQEGVMSLFSSHYYAGRPIVAVIHFAALKSVGESIERPLTYYRENVGGLLTILEAMQAWDCQRIIFSSSATVYGSLSGQSSKCVESMARHTPNGKAGGIQGCVGLTNPYGRTKWMCEAILHDFCTSSAGFDAIALRYFNPVGAHPAGFLSETPRGPPSNLMPNVTAAMQQRKHVLVYGTDYDTVDGTAVRDYIHVVDLAKGHVAALNHLQTSKRRVGEFPLLRQSSFASSASHSSSSDDSDCNSNTDTSGGVDTPPTPFSPGEPENKKAFFPAQDQLLQVFNLGTGRGYTVREVIRGMEKASGQSIQVREWERRNGDVEYCVADPTKANAELGWFAEKTLDDACEDVCRSLRHGKQAPSCMMRYGS